MIYSLWTFIYLMYWVGHKVHSGFSYHLMEKPERTFLANTTIVSICRPDWAQGAQIFGETFWVCL